MINKLYFDKAFKKKIECIQWDTPSFSPAGRQNHWPEKDLLFLKLSKVTLFLCLPGEQLGPGPKPTFIKKKRRIYQPIEGEGGECIVQWGLRWVRTKARDPKREAESSDLWNFLSLNVYTET